MVIAFCGHSSFCQTEEYEKKLLALLEKAVGNERACMYLGGYGNFDAFAYKCCKKYKEAHPNISLVFVTPYLTPEYQKNRLEYEKKRYDEIIYPEIEDKPPRLAITYRNRFMMDSADHVVAYIKHTHGGAYKTYMYAKRKGIDIFNLADM